MTSIFVAKTLFQSTKFKGKNKYMWLWYVYILKMSYIFCGNQFSSKRVLEKMTQLRYEWLGVKSCKL